MTISIDDQLANGRETVAVRFYAHQGLSGGVVNYHLDLVYVKDKEQTGKHSMGFYHGFIEEKNRYANIAIKAHSCEDHPDPYGFSLIHTRAGTSAIDLYKAEAIVKHLRPIQRRFDKISKTEGEPLSFDEFVARAIRIFKLNSYYVTDDMGEHRIDDIGGLRDHIRFVVSKFEKENTSKAA